MEKFKRSLFFWSLVLVFFVVAPLIILHSTGYRFDFTRGVFVYSGTITFKSNPQNFNLYINGQLETSKTLNRMNTSFNITGLIPKIYDIKISADGFQPWSKKAEVHSGLASEFWNIILARDSYEKTDYKVSDVEKFFISPKDKLIAYAQNSDAGLKVGILNVSNQSTGNTFSFPQWNILNESKKENIEWSPEEDFLSIPVEQAIKASIPAKKTQAQISPADGIKYAYFIANPKTGTSFNLNDFLGKEQISNVRWDPKDKNFLFFLSEKNLYRADMTDIKNLVLISDNVSSFDLAKNYVYYTKSPNEVVFKGNLDGTGDRKQITNNFPAEKIYPIKRLIVYDDSRIAFIDENDDLYIFNDGSHDQYFKLLGNKISSIQFSNDGKKLLFWSNNEISVYFLTDWMVQPVRAENDLQNITRYSETIKNVQWYEDYEHVIFTVGNQIKIIEADPRDHRNCMDLLQTSGNNFAVYNYSEEKLFFTDQNESNGELQSINFPEPTTLFGF